MTETVGSIRQVLESAYPPHLAEKWDEVGLICGDPQAEVTKVALALDCTLEVAHAAIEAGADMLVVHHPLLLRGVSSVAADTPKGEIIHLLIRHGIALFAAHTNADSARPGVNDKLAQLVGITPGRPLVPKDPAGVDTWGVYIPEGSVEKVQQALFAAGAGRIGEYSESSFKLKGEGQFRPSSQANPAAGERGEVHRCPEIRVEMVAPSYLREKLVEVLREAHPYEEPAFDVVEMALPNDLNTAYGLGRLGRLDAPMTLREFTQQVANNLPETVWGVRAAGDPEKIIETVAVSSGSGEGFLEQAAKLGADVYVSSDMRHHPVDEHLRKYDMAVIDTAHWASEFPWTQQASEIIARETQVDTEILDIRTDPWQVSAHREN